MRAPDARVRIKPRGGLTAPDFELSEPKIPEDPPEESAEDEPREESPPAGEKQESGTGQRPPAAPAAPRWS